MINIILTTNAEHFGKIKKDKEFKIFYLGKNKDGKKYFPDGEIYIKLSKIKKIKGKTVIIHSGMPNPNQGIIELKTVLEILKNKKIKPIEIFFTYFPYGMQDKINKIGESLVAENLIKEFIKYYGVKKIFIIDAHFSNKPWIKKYPIKNISVFDLLTKDLMEKYPNIKFLAPDMGSQKRNKIEGTKKKRTNSFKVEITSNKYLKQKINNQIIAVVDDLIETGETMKKFYYECKKNGAKKIYAVCTHGVLESGIKRIKKVYSKLYLSNSIKRNDSNVEINQKIINIIKK